MISDEWQINNFDLAGNDPSSWQFSAERLMAAADILKKERDIYYQTTIYKIEKDHPIPPEGNILSSEIMLRGFAVECLLKGLYVKQGKKLAENGKLLKIKGVGSHKLRQLSHKINFRIIEKEEKLLMRLEVYMTSIGRYPISTLWENTKIRESLGGPPTYWSMPTDDILYSELTGRMVRQLEGGLK